MNRFNLNSSYSVENRGYGSKHFSSPRNVSKTYSNFLVMKETLALICYSLSMGEKKTSEVGLVLLQRYVGTGFPELEEQLRVTFPFSTGFPDMEHLGTAGGTESRASRHLNGKQHHELWVMLTDE